MTDTRKRLDDTLVWVVFKQPLLYEFVTFIKWEEADPKTMEMPTAGVRMSHNNIVIYYNKEFIDGLTDDGLRFIICHELYHVIMGHVFCRLSEHIIDNMGADIEINQTPYLNIPSELQNKVLDYASYALPASDARETYYKLLMERLMKQPNKGMNGFKLGDLAKKGNQGDKICDDHSKWSETSPDVQEVWRERVNSILEQAAAKGDMTGGEIERIKARWKKHKDLGKLLKRVVGKHIASSVQEASYWRKRNKRFKRYAGTRDAYSPRFAIAIDTSGSMGTEQLETAFSLCRWIKRLGYAGKLLQCDAQVTEAIDLEKLKGEIGMKGRGGTSSIPIFEWIEKNKYNPDMLIFITDLYTDYPDKKPDYKTVWVSVTPEGGATKPPFGRTIYT